LKRRNSRRISNRNQTRFENRLEEKEPKNGSAMNRLGGGGLRVMATRPPFEGTKKGEHGRKSERGWGTATEKTAVERQNRRRVNLEKRNGAVTDARHKKTGTQKVNKTARSRVGRRVSTIHSDDKRRRVAGNLLQRKKRQTVGFR